MLPALDCWYLSGATASGKTPIGIALAGRLDAEIISLDSMAIYRGMDIGTAKPSPVDRRAVPHHLLDVVDPNEDFSLDQYVEAAHEKIAEIQGRGRQVLLVGGTPLYLKALLRGLFSGPAADWEFRRQVEAEVESVGALALHARLAQVDPLAADALHPQDTRRIIRALEVYKITGQPISHLQEQFEVAHPADQCRVFVLQWPREQLHERIDTRVQQMFAAGLVEEVRSLLDRYGRLSRTASQAVGYRQVLSHLEGEMDLPTTIDRVQSKTRQFAKRQLTWFRSLSECRDVPMSDDLTPAIVAEQIMAAK
ncbi:MAG: tRNA (adenosine(37)-N6)-dimethylallyltransferase MiaA [Planctomycetes bacterium]|nr:tRNA (adenosine(37)-N6)-dimethylallyltransferase MiaA [Planctomycetota bacterium]